MAGDLGKGKLRLVDISLSFTPLRVLQINGTNIYI